MASGFQVTMGLAIVGYPAIATSLGVVAARFTPPASAARQAVLAGAAAAGLVTGFLVLAGVPRLPPVDSLGWTPIVTAFAGLVAAIASTAPGGEHVRRFSTWVGLALLAALATYLTGKPTFSAHPLRFVPLGTGVAVTAAFALASSDVRGARPLGTWLAMCVTAALAALCALWGSSASMAMLFGATATVAGAIGIGGWILGIRESSPAAQGVFLAHVAALASYTHLFANLPTLPLVLLAAAVAAPAVIARLSGHTPQRAWLGAVLTVALATLFIGTAAVIMHGNVGDAAASM